MGHEVIKKPVVLKNSCRGADKIEDKCASGILTERVTAYESEFTDLLPKAVADNYVYVYVKTLAIVYFVLVMHLGWLHYRRYYV